MTARRFAAQRDNDIALAGSSTKACALWLEANPENRQRNLSDTRKSTKIQSITEDKNADPNDEDPEATADQRRVGAGKRQRAEEDSEASPPKKEKKKKGAR